MTVDTTGNGDVAVPEEIDYSTIGLEDITAEDLVMPRLKVDHKASPPVLVNSLTGETWTELICVFTGVIKQRIMWPEKLEDGDKPRCKSPNNLFGFPRVSDTVPKSKQFPWPQSGFEPDDRMSKEVAPGEIKELPEGWSSNGHEVLTCASCALQKSGKDEDGKWTPPPCNEQHTYAIMYATGDPEDPIWVPAIFTVQRSGIKPSKAFINGFAQVKQPFFTNYVSLTLKAESRGGNEYAVPVFKKLGLTERNSWQEYALRYRSMRKFLQAAPRPFEDPDEMPDESANSNSAPPAQKAAAPKPTPATPAPEPKAEKPKPAFTPPVPTPAPKSATPEATPEPDDEDLPF